MEVIKKKCFLTKFLPRLTVEQTGGIAWGFSFFFFCFGVSFVRGQGSSRRIFPTCLGISLILNESIRSLTQNVVEIVIRTVWHSRPRSGLTWFMKFLPRHAMTPDQSWSRVGMYHRLSDHVRYVRIRLLEKWVRPFLEYQVSRRNRGWNSDQIARTIKSG